MIVSDISRLTEWNERFESAGPEEILEWAISQFRDGLTMATAFGAEGCVLLDMLANLPPIHVFNLDTGYQFPETLELRERIRERYGITVEVVQSDETVAEMEARFGGPIYKKNPDECCRLRKIVPLQRTLRNYSAWITAIRRDQTSFRANAPIVGWDKKFGLIKVNPLANWTKRDVWEYIIEHDVPYNPLHDEGYPSIGCWPCTRQVTLGQDDRSGRWTGTSKVECGLHVDGDGI